MLLASQVKGPVCPTLTLLWESFDFISEHIRLIGGTLTWSNIREQPSWSRIDMFLINPDRESHFLDVIQKDYPVYALLFLYHFRLWRHPKGAKGNLI